MSENEDLEVNKKNSLTHSRLKLLNEKFASQFIKIIKDKGQYMQN